jgi:hypothetical protein
MLQILGGNFKKAKKKFILTYNKSMNSLIIFKTQTERTDVKKFYNREQRKTIVPLSDLRGRYFHAASEA